MKVLKIIHGYPMRYNAGSEVYSQSLVHGLVEAGHDVEVFARYENPFESDFAYREEVDPLLPEIKLHLVNVPRSKDRYCHQRIDELCGSILNKYSPDIIHIGHLNHLSISLVNEIKKHQIPIIYTLHDFWLMCPRGQFMKHSIDPSNEPWQNCEKQINRICATDCYSRYFSGNPAKLKEDIDQWEKWVENRMANTRKICEKIDLFITPSKYLMSRYIDDFGIPPEKVIYLDYGFDHSRYIGRSRAYPNGKSEVVFGYIGTHIPAKGIHHLIEAFCNTSGKAKLRIWGRPREENTPYLKELAKTISVNHAKKIEWMGEYKNQEILSKVFNNCDAIVVPSIWGENSPLVIHEAQQARLPVITANYGGMAEYVRHNENGLLFDFRNAGSLANELQRIIDNPAIISQLGSKGYLYSATGDIPSLTHHVSEIIKFYESQRMQNER